MICKNNVDQIHPVCFMTVTVNLANIFSDPSCFFWSHVQNIGSAHVLLHRWQAEPCVDVSGFLWWIQSYQGASKHGRFTHSKWQLIVENSDKTAQFGVFPKSGFEQTHLKSVQKKNVIPLSWVVNKDSHHWWQSPMHCVAQSPPIINQETDAALLPGQAASQQLNEMNRDPRCVWSKSSEIKPKGCYVGLKENMF